MRLSSSVRSTSEVQGPRGVDDGFLLAFDTAKLGAGPPQMSSNVTSDNLNFFAYLA